MPREPTEEKAAYNPLTPEQPLFQNPGSQTEEAETKLVKKFI
jgi:hypothetical protein